MLKEVNLFYWNKYDKTQNHRKTLWTVLLIDLSVQSHMLCLSNLSNLRNIIILDIRSILYLLQI